MNWKRSELASFAHNPHTQVSFECSADLFLEQLKGASTRQAFRDAKPMRKTVRAAVDDVRRLQMDYREMFAVDVMPYYEELIDRLANFACELWAYIEQTETEANA